MRYADARYSAASVRLHGATEKTINVKLIKTSRMILELRYNSTKAIFLNQKAARLTGKL
jgi:hypothetical protein